MWFVVLIINVLRKNFVSIIVVLTYSLLMSIWLWIDRHFFEDTLYLDPDAGFILMIFNISCVFFLTIGSLPVEYMWRDKILAYYKLAYILIPVIIALLFYMEHRSILAIGIIYGLLDRLLHIMGKWSVSDSLE